MSEVSPNRFNVAQDIVSKLDAKDGNKDGKITASIWNDFVDNNETGGKHIKSFINLDNAIRSIMTYLSRSIENTKNTSQLDLELLQVLWGDMKKVDDKTDDNGVLLKNTNIPAAGTPPEVDTNPPQINTNNKETHILSGMYSALTPDNADAKNVSDHEILKQKFSEYAGKSEVEIPEGSGMKFTFDKEGYIRNVVDKYNIVVIKHSNDNTYHAREFDPDNDIYYSSSRYENGSVSTYFPSYDCRLYDKSVSFRSVMINNIDFISYTYDDTEYNNGLLTKVITRNSDGSVKKYEEYKYDENGKQQGSIKYDGNGNVIEFSTNCDTPDAQGRTYLTYDGEGNLLNYMIGDVLYEVKNGKTVPIL